MLPKINNCPQTNPKCFENFYNFSRSKGANTNLGHDRRTDLFYIAGTPGVCGHVFWIQISCLYHFTSDASLEKLI